MAAKVKKWVEKNKNFDFDGLELPENYKKRDCYAHCWKGYLICYNFVNFVFKLVQKPVFFPYLPRVAF